MELDHMLPNALFTPPRTSRASRTPSLHSKGSHRGSLLSTTTHRTLVHESKLEADVAFVTLMRRDLLDLWDQPPALSYVDAAGLKRKHTMDYLATLDDGRRIAIMVKPKAAEERRDLQACVSACKLDPLIGVIGVQN